MKLIFCGTPEFAVPTSRRSSTPATKSHSSSPSLTAPPVASRSFQLPPVKQLALKLSLPVLQPERL